MSTILSQSKYLQITERNLVKYNPDPLEIYDISVTTTKQTLSHLYRLRR